MTIEYDDDRAELEAAYEVREYIRVQLQRAEVRHYHVKEAFFKSLLEKQDSVITLLEKT